MGTESAGDGHEDAIVHRQLDTDRDDAMIQIVEIVAELEETDESDLSSLWTCIDDMLTELFSNPPAPEAQLQTTFSYEGYRITVEQDGTAKFVETG